MGTFCDMTSGCSVFLVWAGGSYLFAPEGHWYWRRRNSGCGTSVEGQHYEIAMVFPEILLKRLYGKRSCRWIRLAFEHALVAPTPWQNSSLAFLLSSIPHSNFYGQAMPNTQ